MQDDMQDPSGMPDFSDVESGASTMQDPPAKKKKPKSFLGRVDAFGNKVEKTVDRALTGAVGEVATLGTQLVEAVVPGQQDWSEKVEKKFDDLNRDRFGKKEQGAWGIAEDITQFGIGMAATGAVGKALGLGVKGVEAVEAAEKTGALSKAVSLGGKALRYDLQSKVATVAFMDPVEQNFANLLQKIPGLRDNAVLNALSSDKDNLGARLKALGSETVVSPVLGLGFRVFGKAAAAVLEPVAKYVRAKKLLRAGAITEAEAAKIAQESEEELAKAAEGDFGHIGPLPDGYVEPVKQADGSWKTGNKSFNSEAEATSEAFAHNDALPLPSDHELSTFHFIRESILSGQHPEDAVNLADGIGLNFHYFGTDEGSKATLNALQETYQQAFERGVYKNADVLEDAAKVLTGNADGTLALKQAAAEVGSSLLDPNLGPLLLAHRARLAWAAQYTSRLAEWVDRESGRNATNVAKLSEMVRRLVTDASSDVKTGSDLGRLLQQRQIDPFQLDLVVKSAGGDASENLPGILSGKTDEDLANIARAFRLNGGNAKAARDMARSLVESAGESLKQDATRWDRWNALRFNAMLSGTGTQVKNAVSNAVMTLYRPLEQIGGGALRGDVESMKRGYRLLTSLASNLGDAVTAAKKAYALGVPQLDGSLRETGMEVTSDYAKALANAKHPTLWKWLTLNNIPSKLLMTSDEFFKQLNYRAAVRSIGIEDGLALGKSGEALAKHVDDVLTGAVDAFGRHTNTRAMTYAAENTFTRELAEDGVLESFAKAGEGDKVANRLLSWVMPFRRTPANVLLAATERTPGLWRFSKRMREDLAAGGIRAAEAENKLMMGQMAWSAAVLAAGSGFITGGEPKDPEVRAAKLATGWRPYSVKMGDTYVSYAGMEPFSTIFGTVADGVDVYAALDGKPMDADKFALSAVAGIMQNLTSKSFLEGLNITDALLSGRPNDLQRAISQSIRQVIPGSSFLGEVAAVSDEHFRESQSIVDKVKAQIPAFNTTLEPSFNLFGQPLTRTAADKAQKAFGLSLSTAGDTEAERLAMQLRDDLGDNPQIPAIPRDWKLSGTGFALSDKSRWDNGSGHSPYFRLQQLIGSPEGKLRVARIREPLPSFKDALTLMMNGDVSKLAAYMGPDKARTLSGWPSARPGDGSEEEDRFSKSGSRRLLLTRLVTLYREAALEQVRKEFPKLNKELERIEGVKAGARQEGKQLQRGNGRSMTSKLLLDAGR